jgi:hypothetical protein
MYVDASPGEEHGEVVEFVETRRCGATRRGIGRLLIS